MVDAYGSCAIRWTRGTSTHPALICADFQLEEQDMDWLAQNWIWILFGIAFVAMHLFGHGGHGGHAGHGGHGSNPTSRRDASDATAPGTAGVRPAAPPAGSGPHRH